MIAKQKFLASSFFGVVAATIKKKENREGDFDIVRDFLRRYPTKDKGSIMLRRKSRSFYFYVYTYNNN